MLIPIPIATIVRPKYVRLEKTAPKISKSYIKLYKHFIYWYGASLPGCSYLKATSLNDLHEFSANTLTKMQNQSNLSNFQM